MKIFFLLYLFIFAVGINFIPPKPIFDVKCPAEGRGDTYYFLAWTQIVNQKPTKQVGYVRTVIYGGKDPEDLACPKILINGKSHKMVSRNSLNRKKKCFKVSVCEYQIDENDTEIFVITEDGKRTSVPSIKTDPTKILLIGDGGIREAPKKCKDCKAEIPIYQIREQILKTKYDFIFHLGDTRYSDVECEKKDCQDHLQNWIFEFFAPFYPIFQKAPFALIRGNHETCGENEGGMGYFLFLHFTDVQDSLHCESDKSEQKYLVPFRFTLSNQQFIVMDSSNAQDYPSDNASTFSKMFTIVKRIADKKSTILLTHKPVWASKRNQEEKHIVNWTLQKAFGDDFPSFINLIIAGHIHAHKLITSSTRPTQLIVGNGGIELNTNWKEPQGSELLIQGSKMKFFVEQKYGFDVLVKDKNSARVSWKFNSYFMKNDNRTISWKEILDQSL